MSVSPNPKKFITNGSKKVLQLSAPVIAAPARFPQHAALSKQSFWQKTVKGGTRKIEGLATPPFSEWRGGQPLRLRDFTRERYRHQFSRNPYLMQSSLCRKIYQKAKKIPLAMLISAIESPFSLLCNRLPNFNKLRSPIKNA